MASLEASETRWLVFCVSERPEENAGLWGWCSSTFFAERDRLTFLYCRTETEVITVSATALQVSLRARCHVQGGSHFSVSRLTHLRVLQSKMFVLRTTMDAVPHWMPPAITAALEERKTAFKVLEFIQLSSDLGAGDAIAAWLADIGGQRGRPTLLLMSSRGHTGLRKFLSGTVSGYVTEQAQTPCLIVRSTLASRVLAPDVAGQQRGGRVIGIAIDGSNAGRALVAWCRTYVLRSSDRVTVLHGRRTGQKTDDELAAIDNAISALEIVIAAVQSLGGDLTAPPVTELLAESDDVRDAIYDWVDTHTPDLLVVGSRGLTGALRRMALGSVSSYCITHAQCPIIVVSAAVLADLASEWVDKSHRTTND